MRCLDNASVGGLKRDRERKRFGLLLATSGVLFLAPGKVGAQVQIWEKVGSAGSRMGWRMAAPGDVSGDGIPDVAVGAPLLNSQAGGLQVVSGVDGSDLSVFSAPVPAANDGFANFVAGPGDVTGDSVPDLLVGSLNGWGRLYSGAANTVVFEWPIGGYVTVGSAGDINNDGISDLLLGSALFLGTATLRSGADGSELFGWSTPLGLGTDLTGMCDVTGDGKREILIGAPCAGNCLFGSGAGYGKIFSGADGTLVDQVTGGPFGYPAFGGAVAELGDVTGDGVCEFAVAARTAQDGRGEVRIYSGLDRSLVGAVVGTYTGEWLGDVIDGPGDVDGDGVPDLIAGAPYGPPVIGNVGAAGRALVYSGQDWSVLYEIPPLAGELLEFGRDVTGTGDVNGDGFLDFAIAAAGSYLQPECRVRMFSGAPIGVGAFGSECSEPSGGSPRIGATRSAKVGASSSVNLSKTVPGRGALLLLGFSSAAWWGTPLPLDLGFLGMGGCSLLVSPDMALGITTSAFGPGNGRAVAPIAIPADASLAGGQFYAQWFVAGPGPGPIPGSMTRGLAITIQP